MLDELKKLRKNIDVLDKKFIKLITKRLKIVTEIGKIKKKHGLSIHDPIREKKMLSSRCEEAKLNGVSSCLVKDLLKRIMRESYFNENQEGFKKICLNLRPIIIIGGLGKMGQLFNKMLKLSGYKVHILEKNDWHNAKKILNNPMMVIVSIPVLLVKPIILKLSSLPKDCILIDLTSIKHRPLNVMLNVHSGPVLGLHPMFGPECKNLVKQLIIVCHGRYPEKYEWFLEQMRIWGVKLYVVNAIQHDYYMNFIQILRYFITFSYGLNFLEEDVNLKKMLDLSSPIYHIEIAMIGRFFNQNPELYADIMMSSGNNIFFIKRYYKILSKLITILEKKDKEKFIDYFKKIKTWFKSYAKKLSKKSDDILGQLNDNI
ncbi:bifunctional chorismate mutase/prephenate dehydrogenase [Candidatus Tachikawaea gelatinosa]|uniref:T-protein n=1 Tax=Candidatus Tachikawaea gelatinosa TaxID=1410383 RepID=A0A090AQN1_9ENTR|nr:bifunctional chorismate mutase/prephenate dehydrogenase [Candidatus Tachikawaea gelatinosa]BAP58652.1 fused chorismate mutase T/prephenate dehydrogenase [Candidatus Tachikawaea gelatinosa]